MLSKQNLTMGELLTIMPKENQTLRNLLNKPDVPYVLGSRSVAKEIATHEVAVSPLEKEHFNDVLAILGHPKLLERAAKGEFTIGIIKPKAFQGRDVSPNDEEAAEILLEEARQAFTMQEDENGNPVKDKNREIVFSVHVQMTRQDAERFYALNRERFENVKIKHNGPSTLWDRVTEFMSSDPSTFVLLRDKSGRAPESWRNVIGSTKPDPNEQTLRGRFAKGIENNLFHGSANREEAVREIRILHEILRDKNGKLDVFDEQETANLGPLKEQGILTGNEQILYVTREYSKKRRQEVFTGNKIVFRDGDKVEEAFVYAKDDPKAA
jgi:nucleoside diphosphate kinase